MKVKITNGKINPFGGINFIIHKLNQTNVVPLIDSALGSRVKQAKYKYSEIIIAWIYSNLCGARRLDNMKRLRKYFSHIPDFKYPSPERVSDVFRELAVPTEEFTPPKTNVNHQLNINGAFNDLLLDISQSLGLFPKKGGGVMDYDNTIIANQKCDANHTYKQHTGYQPGVTLLDGVPVYIEGRNGNSAAKAYIEDTIARSFEHLSRLGLKPSLFRSDAAASKAEVLSYLHKQKIGYIIRMGKFSPQRCLEHLQWKFHKKYKGFDLEMASSYTYLYAGKIDLPRVVVVKYTKEGKSMYRAIMTSIMDLSDHEIWKLYNKRGGIERVFDELKNHFNWGRLPFSFLNTNTVFMLVSAIAYNIFQYLKTWAAKKVPHVVQKKYRLEKFIYNLIRVNSKWVEETLEISCEFDCTVLLR